MAVLLKVTPTANSEGPQTDQEFKSFLVILQMNDIQFIHTYNLHFQFYLGLILTY